MLKNTTARGAKMMKMDTSVYALRRAVMGVIYSAGRIVPLPRIEVRIVEFEELDPTMGYAWMGRNIVHISKKYAAASNDILVQLVLHEILHAVKAVKHDESCDLMCANYRPLSTSRAYDLFASYFRN